MKTNFFEQVAGLGINGTLQINLQPQENGALTVSVLLANTNPKITAGKNIPPMLLKGSPQELDEAFFEQVGEPVKQTAKLFANLEAYQKELDKANETAKNKKSEKGKASASKADNDNGEPDDDDDENSNLFSPAPDDKQAKAEKKKQYDEAMERINTLNSQMKYAEAIVQLPDATEYPEKADELKTKREQLQKRQELYVSLQTEV